MKQLGLKGQSITEIKFADVHVEGASLKKGPAIVF